MDHGWGKRQTTDNYKIYVSCLNYYKYNNINWHNLKYYCLQIQSNLARTTQTRNEDSIWCYSYRTQLHVRELWAVGGFFCANSFKKNTTITAQKFHFLPGERTFFSVSLCYAYLSINTYAQKCVINFTYSACYSYYSANRSRRDKKRSRKMSFLICPSSCPCGVLVSCLFLGHLVPLGSLGGIYSAMEGRRRRRSTHGASFTITWKFPARSRIRRTLHPAPGLIPAVPRESWSVTEQINVYCFLSRLDRPIANSRGSHSPGYGGVWYDGAPTHPWALWTPSIRSGT